MGATVCCAMVHLKAAARDDPSQRGSGGSKSPLCRPSSDGVPRRPIYLNEPFEDL
jgi:hypothetical protein